MSVELSFDFVAISILIILMVYFQRKRNGMLASYRVYYSTLIVLLLTATLDVLCGIYHHYPFVATQGMIYTMYVLDLGVTMFIGTIFTVYLLCVCSLDLKLNANWLLAIYVPIPIQWIMIIIFACRSAAVGEEACTFQSHPVLQIFLLVCILYLIILCNIIGIRYHRNQDRIRLIHILGTGMFLLVTLGLQVIFPDYRFICLAASLVMLEMLMSVQRPEEIFDGSDAMKRRFLFTSAEHDFERGKSFFLVFIKLLDHSVLVDSLGPEDAEQFVRHPVAFLFQLKRGATVFQLDNDMLVVKFAVKDKMERDSLLHEIRERFKEPWRSGLLESMLTVSYVTAECPGDVPNIETLRKLVKNIYHKTLEAEKLFSAADILKEDDEELMLAAIRRGLEEDSFKVYYQPIYSTEKKRVVAAEALLRLYDPEYGFVPPEPLIRLAEREGYILRIGEFVFREVCRFYSENHLDEIGIEYIEVNLSAVQCMQNKLAEEFLDIMQEYKLSSDRINFEITETSALTANVEVNRNIVHFELHGVNLSLDDYGTGYSNISYLYNLPFMIMKVDKSILWSAQDNEKADIILRNTFRMAKRLHMKVVMEGVETEEQIRKLLDLKCDYFQGYYFSKPVPGDAFIKYVKEFRLPEVCR
ncbi:MAG: EAL domain-containing protein [Lachnospiraceae bacterium]|nr:EAL domain-containing protein [Lachnospiraceae bacterium]